MVSVAGGFSRPADPERANASARRAQALGYADKGHLRGLPPKHYAAPQLHMELDPWSLTGDVDYGRSQPPTTQLDMVLDVREVADRLKVCQDTVYGLIASGRLRAKGLGKQRAIRVPVRALGAFLDAHNLP
ncbi:MAG: helix-turn-helix domain-containing protein [Roseiflexaceae bacterium]